MPLFCIEIVQDLQMALSILIGKHWLVKRFYSLPQILLKTQATHGVERLRPSNI